LVPEPEFPAHLIASDILGKGSKYEDSNDSRLWINNYPASSNYLPLPNPGKPRAYLTKYSSRKL